MKTKVSKLVITAGLCLTVSLNSCSQDFEKVSNEKVDLTQVNHAQKFSENFYSALKNDSVYVFKDEVIDVIKNQLSPQTQRTMYDNIKTKFGDYENLQYVETYKQKSNELYIHRFKAKFSKSDKLLEIRVVYNNEGKIAGFFLKPWLDMFN